MSRLHHELQRLYGAPPPDGAATSRPDTGAAADAAHTAHALIVVLSAPAEWALVSAMWQGMQADLDLPAPAIAVSGSSGYLLCVSLTAPVPAAQADAFVAALCARYWPDVPAHRITTLHTLDQPADALRLLPPSEVRPGQWSAFVAPDLAPIFSDTPWLDTPPNPEGQADLLCRLGSITPTTLASASLRLSGPQATPPGLSEAPPHAPGLHAAPAAPAPPRARRTEADTLATESAHAAAEDARRFLQQVMADASAPLALRVEAAKALLNGPTAHGDPSPR